MNAANQYESSFLSRNRKPANHTVYFSVNGTLYQPSRAEWSTFETQIWAEVTFSGKTFVNLKYFMH